MVHGEAERDCADSDQCCLLGDPQAWHGRPGLQLRWTGESCPNPAHGVSSPIGGSVPLGGSVPHDAPGPHGGSGPQVVAGPPGGSVPQVGVGPLGASGPQVGTGSIGPDAVAEHGSGNLFPRQRPAGPADGAGSGRDPSTCRTARSGWAGAHRHGAVRPGSRTSRRERPPRRWC